ncbi:AgmX/PglI C-terminal domain-containing protein [Bdellovibrio sp. HCB337]|uniref:AgmX/PglI C-terminal domain-containing protein n=1 Tax=Bdellovibrio sp. HCB337 TaxID=3394358 RepID=UPI0039A78440
MKRTFTVLLVILGFASAAKAQTLTDLKGQYDQVSPLQAPSINSRQVVDAEASNMTPQEEQLAEMKAQDEEAKKAQTEKIYLDTDYQFFQALAVPNEDDEMDQATKKDQVAVSMEQNALNQQAVSGEIKTSAPKMMTAKQGSAFDERRALILKKIATNGQYVRSCILQHKKAGNEFTGTALTLAWEVEPTGKVENAQVKATDIAAQEIKNCVLKALAEWNFGDILKDKTKRSQIEYTYRFVNTTKEASAKSEATKTATPVAN